MATESGSNGFTVTIDGEVIATVNVPATGGWQTWVTQSNVVELPAVEHTLRVESLGGGWNLNWMQFSVTP